MTQSQRTGVTVKRLRRDRKACRRRRDGPERLTLADIPDVVTDWRAALVRSKGYSLYGATPEHMRDVRDSKSFTREYG